MRNFVVLFILLVLASCNSSLEVKSNSPITSISNSGPLTGASLEILGSNLMYVNQVLVSNRPCTVSSQTGSKIICNVADASTPSWANVEVRFSNQSPIIKEKYFAHGAHVVGQSNFESYDIDVSESYESMGGVDLINDKIWVSGGPAIYIYNQAAASFAAPESWYGKLDVKKPDLYNLRTSNLAENNLGTAIQSCWNGQQLFILQRNANRILVYNHIPTSHLEAPAFVIGQQSWNENQANQGSIVTGSTLNLPQGMDCKSNLLAVADTGNHRVLGFNLPIMNSNPDAAWVLGQPNFLTNTANIGGTRSAVNMNNPYDVGLTGTGIFVADATNNRVLYWNTTTITNGLAANLVLGQTVFTTNSSTCSQTVLNSPRSVKVGEGWLSIAVYGHHRIMMWDLAAGGGISSWVNGRGADRVLGQDNFTTCALNKGVGMSAAGLRNPSKVSWGGGRMFVSDTLNYRALAWNGVPASNGINANLILGQSSATSFNYSKSIPNGRRFINPGVIAYRDGILAVPSSRTIQTLVFENITTNYPNYSKVLGQADPYSSEKNNALSTQSGNRMTSPGTAWLSPDLDLFIGEGSNDRTLVWENLPSAASLNSSAQFVIGSDSLTGNKTGPGTKFGGSFGGYCANSTQFFISDPGPSRVVVFDASWLNAKSNGPTATFFIGQTSSAGQTANQGGPAGANTLNYPRDIYCDENNLWVSDARNNRVLRYHLPITSSNPSADLVLGQPDFTTVTAPTVALPSNMNYPGGVTIYNGKLYVTDSGNNRITVWDTIPTVSGTLPSRVIGQKDFYSGDCNRGDLFPSLNSLCSPNNLVIDQNRMAISDSANQRVLILPLIE